MIAALAGLLACQLVGEVLARALAIPIPGPVIGLGLMFGFLVVRGRSHEEAIPRDLGRVADAFLANLSLLFIPAAVGVVQYLGLLRRFAWPIALTVLVSTTAVLVVTAVTFRLVARLHTSRDGRAAAAEPAADPRRDP